MGILGNVVSGAIGYAISEASDSHPVRDFCDRNFSNKSLEDMIRDYAKTRCNIYTYDNNFAKQLHDIARSFEEYNYNDIY